MRPSLKLCLSLVAVLAVAACAGETPAPSPPPMASGHGTYKVGAPYKIEGVWYFPKEDMSYTETGIASWYGEQFHGRATANGEVFDLNALSAAHRTLPLPSVVQVTNLENGRSIKLRVNDRGPYARGRIIDISRRGAQLLGFEGQGTAKVRVQIVVADSMQVAAIAKHNGAPERLPEPVAVAIKPYQPATGTESPPPTAVAATEPIVPVPAAPRESVTAVALAPPPGTRTAENKTIEPPKPKPQTAIDSAVPAEAPPLPERVTVVPVKATQIYVQAGAFSQRDNADRMETRLRGLGSPVKVSGIRVNGASIFRVRLGPLLSVDEADRVLDRVLSGGVAEARIVVD